LLLAIKPKDNESFYREVDEELRRDQVRSYWERYGKLAIAGAVLLLALLAGILWWNNQRQVKAGEKGSQLISAFDEISAGNKAAALPKLDALEKTGTSGYRAAAILTRADLAIEENKLEQAAALFKQVAEDTKLDETYRNLALVRQTHVEYDKLPPQAVVDRLKPLAVAGNPWFGSAGEMVGIAHLKLNRPAEAARIFAALAKDKQVPESVRSRAGQMAGSLGVDVVEEPAAAAQEGN
jgi:hypothetical protein